jgi:hypothetical protein
MKPLLVAAGPSGSWAVCSRARPGMSQRTPLLAGSGSPARLLLVAVAWAVVLSGCGDNSGGQHQSMPKPTPEVGVTYSIRDGLLVSPETAKFIGLETVEVSDRPIKTSIEIIARIFRAANRNEPRAQASGWLASADAPPLRCGSTSTSSPAAEVLRVDRRGEPQTAMVEVIFQVSDPVQPLSEGGVVTIRFAAASTNSVMAVPNSAVLKTTAGDFVYVENGIHFARAAIELGRTDGEFTEVTEGLLTGDRVVIRPVMTLWLTELHNVNGGDACCIRRETNP